MAFTWVKKLAVGDTVYEFIVPPCDFTYTPGSSFYDGAQKSRYEEGYAEALANAADIAGQVSTIDFAKTSANTTYAITGNGGIQYAQGAGVYPAAVDLIIKWFGTNLNLKANMAVTFANYSAYTENFCMIGLCCAVDHDARLLFIGFATGGFFDRPAPGQPFATWAVQIQSSSTNYSLYDEFIGFLPSTVGPYDDGGTSTTGGGENATYDDTSDEIDVPSVPLLNLTFSGFMSAYAPNLQQVQDLASYVWSDWDAGNYLNKLFANVADAIISLHMLPFSPSASTTPADVMVGKYDSGVDMYPLNAQFNDVNCGTLQIPLYWDNYLDFNPYTKLTLFLPYVGEVTLNPDEVMGQTIGIKYRIDALTGAFVCFITRSDHKIVGQYQGNCALSVPLSSANYEQLHAAMLTIATAAVGAAATTGGLVGGFAAGGEAGMEAALGVMDTKVKHNVSGALGSAAGFLGSQKPYLIIERARQCLPQDLGTFVGYPSQITETLGALSGFTQVAEIILDGIPLTDQEKEQLRGILEGGIII